MAKLKNFLIIALSVVLIAALAIGGTVAYITDTDEDVAVMTSGNVKIAQNIYQRGENGLEPFVQGAAAYPAVYGLTSMPALEANNSVVIGFPEADSAVKFFAEGSIHNAIDKIVTVKNIGSSSAFVRTLVLLPSIMEANYDTTSATLNTIEGVVYRGASYKLLVFTYNEALASGVEALPSLLEIYVRKTVTQAQRDEYLDADGKLVVAVVSQAVQTAGFETLGADVALDEAFGLLSASCNPWVPVEQKWDGDPDAQWYNPARNEFILTTAGQLAGLAELVNDGVSFQGKTVKLGRNIDLNNQLWTPIGLADGGGQNPGEFKGTFDGCGYTVYNLNVVTEGGYSAGLFGATAGTVKNFTIENARVVGIVKDSAPGTSNGVGVVAGSTNNGARIDNVHVKNAVVAGNRYLGGIVGYYDGDITNCSVTDITITATPDKQDNGKYDNGDKVGGIAGYQQGPGNCGWFNRQFTGNSVKNAVITAYRDVAGLIGAAHVGGTASITNGVTTFVNNTVDGLEITIDQLTGCYGLKTPNANALVGRNLGLDFTISDTNTYTNVSIDEVHFSYYDGSASLQDTLDAMSAGDLLVIAEGDFTVGGTITIPDGVTVVGLGNVKFTQLGNADDIFACAGDATIINIDFVVNTGWAYAICCSDKRDTTADGNIVIEDCGFYGQEGKVKRYAISKPQCGSLTVTNCYFDGSTLDVGIGGVKNDGGSTTTITGCTFDNFTAEAIGYVGSFTPANFEADVIANNIGLNADNVVGY